MKSIILFRHGKSEWNIEYDTDHNRPLASRGIKAAKLMGIFLMEKDEIPGLIICSTAIRAKETLQRAAKAGHWSSSIIFEPEIYGGSPSKILSIAKEQLDSFKSICFIGHEPNFSMFISRTCKISPIRFTTANMAKINFKVDSWKNLRFNEGFLAWHQRPKELNH